MNVADLVRMWRDVADANDKLAADETNPERLAQHEDAARWCRDIAAKLEAGKGP